jgi:glutathione S-transferase
MVCAHELGIAEQIEKHYALVSVRDVNVDMLQVNPLGRIPALVTNDGTTLYDSVVICEYLDAAHGEHRLFPAEGGRRWDALRRHALANGMLETLVRWRDERSRSPAQQSAEVLAAFERKVISALDAADAEVRSIEHAAPDIGHCTLAVALGYLDFRYADVNWRKPRPRLTQWFDAFAARPSMQQTLPLDEQAGH